MPFFSPTGSKSYSAPTYSYGQPNTDSSTTNLMLRRLIEELEKEAFPEEPEGPSEQDQKKAKRARRMQILADVMMGISGAFAASGGSQNPLAGMQMLQEIRQAREDRHTRQSEAARNRQQESKLALAQILSTKDGREAEAELRREMQAREMEARQAEQAAEFAFRNSDREDSQAHSLGVIDVQANIAKSARDDDQVNAVERMRLASSLNQQEQEFLAKLQDQRTAANAVMEWGAVADASGLRASDNPLFRGLSDKIRQGGVESLSPEETELFHNINRVIAFEQAGARDLDKAQARTQLFSSALNALSVVSGARVPTNENLLLSAEQLSGLTRIPEGGFTDDPEMLQRSRVLAKVRADYRAGKQTAEQIIASLEEAGYPELATEFELWLRSQQSVNPTIQRPAIAPFSR